MENNLLFIFLNTVNDRFAGADFEIYSSYLRSYLKQQGILTRQYINCYEQSFARLMEDISNQPEEKLVFCVNEYNFYLTKTIVNNIKALHPEKYLICIGPSTKHICDSIDNIKFDFFSINEYYTLQKLVKGTEEVFHTNNDFDRYGFGEKVLISDIPHPYSNGILPAREVVNVGLLTSKGCVGKCNFCSYIEHDALQKFSIESIIDELRFIQQQVGNCNLTINFLDDCFSLSSERIIQLCDEIIKNNFKFKFWCCTRYDLVNKEVIKKMKQAGFIGPVVGLESAAPEVLLQLGKVNSNHTPEEFLNRIKEINKNAKEEKFNLVFSVNFGLYGEKLENALETINFLIANNIKFISVNYMTVFPGSKIFREKNNQYANVLAKEGVTQLPLRTYYTNYDIGEVKKIINRSHFGNMDYPTYNPVIHRSNIIEWISGINYKESDLYSDQIKYVKYDALTNNVAKFIKENLSINGVILQETSSLNIDRKLMYCDNRKLLKYEINKFDNSLKLLYNRDIYVENQYFINRKSELSTIWVNNYIQQFNKLRIHHFNTIEEKIEFVDQNFKYLINNNLYSAQRVEEELFNDMCQFANECTANCNPRVSIKEDQVYLCSKKYLGNLQDENYGIMEWIKDTAYNSDNKTNSLLYCRVINTEEQTLLENYLTNNPYIPWYVNTLVYIFKNIDYISLTKEFRIFTEYNHDFREMVNRLPRGICFILGNAVCIAYNASNHRSYICNYDEKRMVESFLSYSSSKYDEKTLEAAILKICKKTL